MSCVITNITSNKETECRLTNVSTINPNMIAFAKKEEHKISSIEHIINDMEPIEFLGAKVKVLLTADQKMVNSFKFCEYIATDDGESSINITIFEELIDKVNIDMKYSIFNLQAVPYNNQK